MPRRFANGTTITATKTAGDIAALLARHGIDDYAHGRSDGAVQLCFMHNKIPYRFDVPMPDITDERKRDRETNRRWRVLYALVKAKLVAIEEGLETFEEAFAMTIVTPNGDRLRDRLLPEIANGKAQQPNLKLLGG